MLSGFTIVSVLLVVWARFGFSLDFSRSSASTGECHWQSPDERADASCACNAANRANLCHVCTPSWKEGNTDYSDGQWTAWDNEGWCRPSCPLAKFPYLTARSKKDGSTFSIPQGCVEKPDDCPDGYHVEGSGAAAICAGDSVATPPVTPPVTPPATPTTSVAPTTTPVVTINSIPATLTGTALGPVSGTASDAVGVTTVRVVIRKNPNSDGTCSANSQDWDGAQWVTGCQIAGSLSPTFTAGTSVAWSLASTPH